MNASKVPASLVIYTAHSVANASDLPTTYGMTEVLMTALFTWFMFWQARWIYDGYTTVTRRLQLTPLFTWFMFWLARAGAARGQAGDGG